MIIHQKITGGKMTGLWRCLLVAAALCSVCLSVPPPGPHLVDPHLVGPHLVDPRKQDTHLVGPRKQDPHLLDPLKLNVTSFAQSSANGNKLSDKISVSSLDLKVQQSGISSSVVEITANNDQLEPSVIDPFWADWIKYLTFYLTSNDSFDGRAKTLENSFRSLLEELWRLVAGNPRGAAAAKTKMTGVEGRSDGLLAYLYHVIKRYLGKPPGIMALANYDPVKIAATIAAVWGINALFWVSYLPKIERQEPIAGNFLNMDFNEEMAGQLVGQDAGQGLGQDAGQSLGPDAGQSLGQNADQSLGQDADQSLGQDTGQNTGQNVGQDTGQNFGQDTGQSFGQDTGQSFGQDTGQNFGQDTGQSFGQDTSQNFGQDTGQSFGQDVGQRFSPNTGERFGQNTGQRFDQYFGQNAGQYFDQDASESFLQNYDPYFNRYVDQGFAQYPHQAFTQTPNGNFHQGFHKRNGDQSEDSVESFSLDSRFATVGSLRQQHSEWPHPYPYT
ncbi:uncharacterized protein [Procambarus clarkii]|uniref:uncharacterized protein isoform X1 n=1 Tax=Procambarus clarkii TaxID=6728 RepID=UPI00374448EB